MCYKSLLFAALVLGACGVPRNGMQPQKADTIQQVRGEEIPVSYEAQISGENEIELRVTVEDKVIDMVMDTNEGLQRIDGNSSILTAEQREALAQAASQYATEQRIDSDTPAEKLAVYLFLDYLASAPSDHAIRAKNFGDSLALKNEGITCIKKGATIRAEWNTRAASYVSENIVTNTNWPDGYGCMGRCGADCGWGAPSAYTKDCMDHDACSYRNNASGGTSDPNCGDEWNEAADDWTFGVLRGCWG